MKKILQSLCMVAVMATSINVYSQNAPNWLNIHTDLENSRLVTYSAIADSEEQARAQIQNQVLTENSLTTGQQATVKVNTNGEFISSGIHNLTTKARRIYEFHEIIGNQHCVYWLVQIAKNPTYPYELVEITDKYGYIAESFVPGMAQIKKGQTGKGIFFIAAEAACIGTIIVAESQRSSFQSKIKTGSSDISSDTTIV